LIEVDVVGAQPAQAAFHGALDVVPVERRAPAAHRGPEPASAGARDLGGDQERLAAPALLEPVADDLLAAPRPLRIRRHGIDLGDVEEVDALRVREVEHRVTLLLVREAAESHRAEADLRYHEAGPAESSRLHVGLPSQWGPRAYLKTTATRDRAGRCAVRRAGAARAAGTRSARRRRRRGPRPRAAPRGSRAERRAPGRARSRAAARGSAPRSRAGSRAASTG